MSGQRLLGGRRVDHGRGGHRDRLAREANRARADRVRAAGRLAPPAVIAVLGGLGAALSFAISTLALLALRRGLLDPRVALGWVMLVGAAIVVPAVLLFGLPANLSRSGGRLAGPRRHRQRRRAAARVPRLPRRPDRASSRRSPPPRAPSRPSSPCSPGEPLSVALAVALAVVAVGVVLTTIVPGEVEELERPVEPPRHPARGRRGRAVRPRPVRHRSRRRRGAGDLGPRAGAVDRRPRRWRCRWRSLGACRSPGRAAPLVVAGGHRRGRRVHVVRDRGARFGRRRGRPGVAVRDVRARSPAASSSGSG